MLRLEDFVEDYITEAGRGRPRKNRDNEEASGQTQEIQNIADVDPKNVKIDKKAKDIAKKVKPGVDADNNGTHGSWDVDPPSENDNLDEYDDDSLELSINTIELLDRFTAAQRSRGGSLSDKDNHGDFFIIGEAGWGKTSIITKMAKQFGRSVITVYLDKAMKEDLGGIPVPREGVKQNSKEAQDALAYQDTAMPSWAYYMLTHPKDKFLLFFDEMNQADPGVMNALMPIVLEKKICGYKFNNFMVGAAGNFKHENGAVEELSGPLMSRFKPIITWSADNEQWNEALRYLRKKEWENVLGKDLFDSIENLGFIFENPRELEHKLLQWLEGIKEQERVAIKRKLGSPERILKRIDELVSEKRMNEFADKGRKEIELSMQQTAELASNWILGKTDKKEEEERGRGTSDMIPDELKETIKKAIMDGCLVDDTDNTKYGISRENIIEFFTDPDVYGEYECEPINAEMVDRLIAKFEEDGVKFKFEKNEEWKKLKYEDPCGE